MFFVRSVLMVPFIVATVVGLWSLLLLYAFAWVVYLVVLVAVLVVLGFDHRRKDSPDGRV
jgi:hypothetical protein